MPPRPLRTVLFGHAREVREFRERPQLDGRVAREIASQPSKVAGAVDDQDSLVGRIHQPDDIGVDPQLAPEPVGEKAGANWVSARTNHTKLHRLSPMPS